MAYLNKGKLIFCTLAVLSSIHQLSAQDRVTYGLYFNNWKIVNPAASGMKEAQKFDILYRTTYGSKMESVPANILLSYENHLKSINSGLGVVFENQQTGVLTRVFGKALYNYQIDFNDQRKLSFGTGLGLLSQSLDFSSGRVFDQGDPLIITNVPPSTVIVLDFGIVYKQNNLEAGLAIKNVLESRIEESQIEFYNRNNVQYLTVYGQYDFDFSIIRFSPSMFIQTDYDILTTDINVLFEVQRLVLLGGSYRVSDNENLFNFNAGVTYQNNIRLMAIAYSSGYKGFGNIFELSVSITIDSE